jgi:alpha-L-fucosidase
MKKIYTIYAMLLTLCINVYAYIYPTEQQVLETLDDWQDRKFGLFIHWGIYTELDCVESWYLCNEPWVERPYDMSYDEFKQWYWSGMDSFNPSQFNPEQWAEVAKNAGMKYLVFTTKHHDGFCMFDTKQTDFSIMHGAFAANPRANATKEVFNAFREQDFMIGAYFSKPDWHCPYYWWDAFPTPDRYSNYDISLYPERWTMFKDYTYNQIEELMGGEYGKIDILWLDGGWVAPPQQDINMPRIGNMARSYNPGVIMVDRYGVAEYYNYETPEQSIPSKQILTPWESCITLGDAWNYRSNDKYKSATKVIHTLVEIVAKGGCYNLGASPDARGLMPDSVIVRLNKVGEWLAGNGEAIYGTRPTAVYKDPLRNVWFTQSKDTKKIYATVCFTENTKLPTTVTWEGNEPAAGTLVRCLQTDSSVEWEKTAYGVVVKLPQDLPDSMPALAFEFENPALAIDNISETKIWSNDGQVIVQSGNAMQYNTIRIYTPAGLLLRQETAYPGLTRIPLRHGSYIVEFRGMVKKVIV